MFFLNKFISKQSSVKLKVLKNVYWAILSKVVNMAGALLVGIFVARYLGPAQYGLMNYVISFVSLFLILANFGFENIEIREESRHPEETAKIIGTTFLLRLLFSLIAYVIIITVAFIYEAEGYTIFLISLYGLVVFSTPFDVIRNYYSSIVKNEYICKVSIARTIWSSTFRVVLLFCKASLIWFVVSLLIDALFLVQGYLYVYKKNGLSIKKWSYDMDTAIYMIQQSFPLLISGAAATIFLKIDQVMIGNMINKESVGYFSVATRFVEVLIFIPGILINTISPILTRTKKNSVEDYYAKAQIFINCVVWGSMFTSVIFCFICYPIIKYTFGEQYILAVRPMQILAFKLVAVSLNIISGQILIIDGKQKLFVIRSLSGCFVCILLNYLIIPLWGINGVAFIVIFTQLIAGYIIHAVIPQYRYVFKMQTKSIFVGWKDFTNIKRLIV